MTNVGMVEKHSRRNRLILMSSESDDGSMEFPQVSILFVTEHKKIVHSKCY